jgi:hypothetical protein
MRPPETLRAMVLSAAMAALGLTLPAVFHMVGLGSRFLPMLLPLLLNGFLVPAPWAAATGLLTPFLSSLATGMPPLYPPVAVALACEGAVAGGVAALTFRRGRGNLWAALISAIVAGRLTALMVSYGLARQFGLPPAFASLAILVQGVPGVALQVAVIPVVVRSLRRRPGLLFQSADG